LTKRLNGLVRFRAVLVLVVLVVLPGGLVRRQKGKLAAVLVMVSVGMKK
jgi:hypothetical protein